MDTQSLPTAPAAASHDLLTRIANGDQRALRQLYGERSGLVMAVASRVLGHREEAEAVVEETFLEVWQSARRVAGKNPPMGAWVADIARRRARARLARRTQRPAEASGGPEPLPMETSLSRLERRRVGAALGTLPPDQRVAVELAWFGCLSLRALAERLAEPIDAVEAKLRNGVDRLARALSGASEKSA